MLRILMKHLLDRENLIMLLRLLLAIHPPPFPPIIKDSLEKLAIAKWLRALFMKIRKEITLLLLVAMEELKEHKNLLLSQIHLQEELQE